MLTVGSIRILLLAALTSPQSSAMVNLGLASGLLVGASAATLKVTWSDRGDADTHAKISDLQPTEIQTGTTNKLVGTGVLVEDVNGATFSSVIKADGVQVASCRGEDELPLSSFAGQGKQPHHISVRHGRQAFLHGCTH